MKIMTANMGAGILVLAVLILSLAAVPPAQQAGNESLPDANLDRTRPRVIFVKVTDFYLKDGRLVSGRVVSEDRFKVTIERTDGSALVLSTYSKKDVDGRTVQNRTIPEARYYTDLADYFMGRTWDFRDDPDDFFQAIRCYEKARKSLAESEQPDLEKIEQIDNEIKKVENDRQEWIRQAESRARLRTLEFDATVASRVKNLEDTVGENKRMLAEVLERFDKIAADRGRGQFEKNISAAVETMSRRLDSIQRSVEENRRAIGNMDQARRNYYPPGVYPVR